jgi:hypothetical protein
MWMCVVSILRLEAIFFLHSSDQSGKRASVSITKLVAGYQMGYGCGASSRFELYTTLTATLKHITVFASWLLSFQNKLPAT